MKSFLQNLLIFFALSLCGLISYQWVRETDLRKNVQHLTDTVHDKMENIQNLQASITRDEGEIKRLDGLRISLTDTVKSNEVHISTLVRTLDKTTNELVRANMQVDAYKEAIARANDAIKTQNENIKKQNEDMAKLSEERNEVVKKFNKMAADYNDLANKWNKQQEELAKMATNSPAKK